MGIKVEAGTIIGNTEDKYNSGNFIARRLIDGFFRSLDGLVERTGACEVHEVGCGEGYLARRLSDHGLRVRASDFSTQIIQTAHTLSAGYDIAFKTTNIYDLDPTIDQAELVICCEVMEHLEDPGRGIAALRRITDTWCILSVPREPIWRALNMARGKYWDDLGNTPGHLQHWSTNKFINFVGQHFDIVEVRQPLPWTMILCRT